MGLRGRPVYQYYHDAHAGATTGAVCADVFMRVADHADGTELAVDRSTTDREIR